MRYLKAALKAAFIIGLLYFLSRKGFISVQSTRHAFTRWRLMVAALSLMTLNVVLGAVRWHWLLKAQNLHLRFGRTLELTLVGNFFNVALPGAVSGDFVKAFYVGREIDGRRAQAFGSILFDRVAGLSALVFVSGAAMLLAFASFSGAHGNPPAAPLSALRPFLITSFGVVVAFYGYLFLVRERHDPVLMGLRRLEHALPMAHSMTQIYLGLRHYHHHRLTVLRAFLLSVVIHILVGSSLLIFAHALGETGIAEYGLFTVFPLGLLITAVPVAPAGVGTGHAAFAYLFGLIGSARGADIFTMFALSNLLFGAMGGLVYLRFRGVEAMPRTETVSPAKTSLSGA